MFSTWLEKTKELQEQAYGVDYDVFTSNSSDSLLAVIEYVRWNMLAIDDELAEMRQAMSWKPWQHDDPYLDREEVVKEAVDVLHFVANIIAAMGYGDDKLSEMYDEKMQRNRQRQLKGYRVKDAGVKCELCSRAIDDVGRSSESASVCAKCEKSREEKK